MCMSNFSKPRNIVTRSGGLLRGVFSSTKYEKQIKWECDIERDIIPIFEFSWRIIDVTSQPFRSSFLSDGDKTSRTPDFLLTTKDEEIIVECKSAKNLARPEIAEHLRLAKVHFEELGYRYFVATDQTIRSGHPLDNARKLLRYRMRQIQNKNETNRIYQQLDAIRMRFTTPNFSQAMECTKSYTDLLVLMASGLIFFDFHTPIQDTTQLSFFPILEVHDAAKFIFC